MSLIKETALIQLQLRIQETIKALDTAIQQHALPETDIYPAKISLQALLNMTHEAIEKAWKPGSI